MLQFFRNPNDLDNANIRTAIRKWLDEKGKLNESTVVSIDELNCCGDQCPHITTVITIFGENHTQEIFKIPKPLVFIRKIDLAI